MRNSKGFTLVEIAVVLIVIGLLIGGVLKGAEMISNAQVNGAITQADKIRKAFRTFHDAYYTFPGDLQNAPTVLQNCVAGTFCGNSGNGDQIVGDEFMLGTNANGTVLSFNLAAPTENLVAWAHLGASGIYNETAMVPAQPGFGESLPVASGGGGWTVLYNGGNLRPLLRIGAFGAITLRSGHWLLQVPNARTNSGNILEGGAFLPEQIGRFDRKIDDGRPNTGSILAFPATDPAGSGAAQCATAQGTGGDYAVSPTMGKCNIAFFMFE